MQSQDVTNKPNHEKSNDWKVIANLLPYLWTFKGRVILALSCLIAAKVANLGVPILLKFLVDSMSVPPGLQTLIVVPVALIVDSSLVISHGNGAVQYFIPSHPQNLPSPTEL
jgi:ATP-binding cassette subfamily B protein